MRRNKSRGRLFPKGGGDDVAPPNDDTTPWPRSPPSGPTSRTPTIYVKVNSILSMVDLNTNLNGMLPHAYYRCVIRCQRRQGPIEKELPWCKEEGRRRREERRRKEERRSSCRSRTRPTGSLAGPPGPWAGQTGFLTGSAGRNRIPDRCHPEAVQGLREPRPVTVRPSIRFGPGGPAPDPVRPAL